MHSQRWRKAAPDSISEIAFMNGSESDVSKYDLINRATS